MRHLNSIFPILLAALASAASAHALEFTLDPVLNQQFRYRDIMSQSYANAYIAGFNYDNSNVRVILNAPGAEHVSGRIVATGLKPNFAYQIKLEGVPTRQVPSGDDATNEKLGFMGRWWRYAPGTPWNAFDTEYLQHKDNPAYIFSGYLLMDFFVTDASGAADYRFIGNSSYHVLWRSDQWINPGPQHGPLRKFVLPPTTAPAYDVSLPERTTHIFAEHETTRALPGTLKMPTGRYRCNFGLTEESFHESGGTSGFWAWAFKSWVEFDIKKTPAIQWNFPAPLDAGTPLSGIQLNATANTPGSFNYSPPLGTVLPPGNHMLEVTFVPDDADNYVTASMSVPIVVGPLGTQTIQIASVSGKTYGDKPFAVDATSDAGLPVTLIVTSGPATVSGHVVTITGAGTVTLQATQAGDSAFAAASAQATFTVAPAALVIIPKSVSRSVGHPNPEFSLLYMGFVNGDSPASLTKGPSVVTDAKPLSPTGNYVIIAGEAANPDYVISYQPGTLTITNSAPEISSAAIVVFPNPARTIDIIHFAVAASDSDNHTLSYAWDFGDTSSTTESSALHRYTAAGTYRVKVTIRDGFGGSAVAETDVVVDETGGGASAEQDSDGDGFSDTFEFAMGSNPSSAADTPWGLQPGSSPGALTVSKLSIGLKFGASGSDSIQLQCSLPAENMPAFSSQVLGVDVGGVGRVFTLDKKGSGGVEKSKVRFKLMSSKATGLAVLTLQATLKGKQFETMLADEGLSAASDEKKVARSVQTMVLYGGKYFQQIVQVDYSSKKGRSAQAKRSLRQ